MVATPQLVEQRSQLEEKDALVATTKEKLARQAKLQVKLFVCVSLVTLPIMRISKHSKQPYSELGDNLAKGCLILLYHQHIYGTAVCTW